VLARFLQTPAEASGEAIVPTPAAASSLCHASTSRSGSARTIGFVDADHAGLVPGVIALDGQGSSV